MPDNRFEPSHAVDVAFCSTWARWNACSPLAEALSRHLLQLSVVTPLCGHGACRAGWRRSVCDEEHSICSDCRCRVARRRGTEHTCRLHELAADRGCLLPLLQVLLQVLLEVRRRSHVAVGPASEA